MDSVADALMRSESDEEQDSDDQMETEFQTRRRYFESTQDQVSDPDL